MQYTTISRCNGSGGGRSSSAARSCTRRGCHRRGAARGRESPPTRPLLPSGSGSFPAGRAILDWLHPQDPLTRDGCPLRQPAGRAHRRDRTAVGARRDLERAAGRRADRAGGLDLHRRHDGAGRRRRRRRGGSGSRGCGAGEARDLMPYQRLFRTLGGEDQRLFRELQEGLIEAENARSAARSWPAPAALAAQGIPPFADVPARGGRRRYRWELRQEGLIVNYLGVPADRRDPAFLLLVQEPDPQVPAAGGASPAGGGMPASGAAAGSGTSLAAQATDEIHHRLADGPLLHVSTWMREPPAGGPGGAASGAGTALGARGGIAAGGDRQVIAEPYARGWIQLLVGAVGR